MYKAAVWPNLNQPPELESRPFSCFKLPSDSQFPVYTIKHKFSTRYTRCSITVPCLYQQSLFSGSFFPLRISATIILSFRGRAKQNLLCYNHVKNGGFFFFFLSDLSYCSSFSLLLLEVQLSSVAQSCPTLHNPMDCSTPGFPVLQQLPELAETNIH